MLNALHIPIVLFICTILYKNTVQFEILYFKTLFLHILEYASYLVFSVKINKILEKFTMEEFHFSNAWKI